MLILRCFITISQSKAYFWHLDECAVVVKAGVTQSCMFAAQQTHIANKPDDKKKLLFKGQEWNASPSLQSNENGLTYKRILKTYQQFILTNTLKTNDPKTMSSHALVNTAIVLQGS